MRDPRWQDACAIGRWCSYTSGRGHVALSPLRHDPGRRPPVLGLFPSPRRMRQLPELPARRRRTVRVLQPGPGSGHPAGRRGPCLLAATRPDRVIRGPVPGADPEPGAASCRRSGGVRDGRRPERPDADMGGAGLWRAGRSAAGQRPGRCRAGPGRGDLRPRPPADAGGAPWPRRESRATRCRSAASCRRRRHPGAAGPWRSPSRHPGWSPCG
jgi:hypothetical protein